MQVTLLIQAILWLIVILAILIFFLVYVPGQKKKKKAAKKSTPKHPSDYQTLPALLSIIKTKNSSNKELKTAIDLILRYHGTIHPKLGIRAHPEFDTYSEIILRLARHKNTSKDIILKFDKELTLKNPAYKVEISDSLTKGLNTRGY